MTLELWKRDEKFEVRSHDGSIIWARIERVAPYYRVRLLNGPGSQLKKTGSLKAAKDLAVEWAREQINQRTQ